MSFFLPKYLKVKVDAYPKIIVPKKKDFKVLIKNYANEHDGKSFNVHKYINLKCNFYLKSLLSN